MAVSYTFDTAQGKPETDTPVKACIILSLDRYRYLLEREQLLMVIRSEASRLIRDVVDETGLAAPFPRLAIAIIDLENFDKSAAEQQEA